LKSIATLGSHCALQVLKGAKDEGFQTVLICEENRLPLYNRFKMIDQIIVVNKFSEIVKKENLDKLNEFDSILIPHGTLISEVGIKATENELKVPIFGNRNILRWEAERELKEELMIKAELNPPNSISDPKDINQISIVKLPGAAGGKGYFLANDFDSFNKGLEKLGKKDILKEELYIQEYIIGVPVYFHYFYSILTNEVELLGIDRRYETSIDGFGRLPSEIQSENNFDPSYIVVGNQPLVLRESLLEEVYRMGERFVKAAEKIVPPGMIGPFCIEGIYDQDAKFIPFEFSARIVAGTNLFVNGSPYTDLTYNKPVSMGRRISMEIKDAIEKGKIESVTT